MNLMMMMMMILVVCSMYVWWVASRGRRVEKRQWHGREGPNQNLSKCAFLDVSVLWQRHGLLLQVCHLRRWILYGCQRSS